MPSHPKLAAEFVKNKDRAHWHDQSLWFVRSKRDKAAKQIPEWELLREQASKIKMFTVSHLPDLLEEMRPREACRFTGPAMPPNITRSYTAC